MAARDGLWRECFPGGLGQAAGALSPGAPLAELVSGTTQSRRGGDPGELFCGHLSCLSSQRALYQKGEGQGENFNPFASIHRPGTLVSPNAPRQPCLSSLAMLCGQASKARFLRGFAATACAAHAIVASQRRSCRPKPSRLPSTWCASVRCCNARLLASRPRPNVLSLLLLNCDHAWQHDVRTKFPSRVIHTPRLSKKHNTNAQPFYEFQLSYLS